MNGTTCCFVGVSWEPQAIESAVWVSCDDGVMAAFSSAGCTGTGCAAARLVIEFDLWMSPNTGIASCTNAACSAGGANPICAAIVANCLAAISMPLGSMCIVGVLCCHIGIALRNFKRRPLKLASSRRDKPRFGCELDLAPGSTSSWVNTYVGIVAGSASQGVVAHIGVASGHVSPHLVAGDGRQARRRVVLATDTPMGFIIPQLGGG